MARPRNPNRDKAKEEWLKNDGSISTKELAEVAGVTDGRIRKWKSEDKWTEALEEKLSKKKRGGQKGNSNAVGHGAPDKNKNAETHGAYSTIHLEDLSPADREYIESITLDTQQNMLRELQLLIAKENDLKKKIRALEQEDADTLHVDRVVEMLVPKGSKQLEENQKKLEELIVQRNEIEWEIETSDKPSKHANNKLDKYERQIAELRDKISDAEGDGDGKGKKLTTAMQTVIKASPFDRALKLEAELNKTHGRIIKLLDTIKSYELDSRRLELEEKKYRLAKQKLTGAYNINPDTGEVDDTIDDENDDFEV